MAEKKEKKKEAKKLGFFTGLVAELKRVAWPDRKKLTQAVAAVLMIALLFTALIWIVDSVVSGGLRLVGFHEVKEDFKPAELPAPVVPAPTQPAETGK